MLNGVKGLQTTYDMDANIKDKSSDREKVAEEEPGGRSCNDQLGKRRIFHPQNILEHHE